MLPIASTGSLLSLRACFRRRSLSLLESRLALKGVPEDPFPIDVSIEDSNIASRKPTLDVIALLSHKRGLT